MIDSRIALTTFHENPARLKSSDEVYIYGLADPRNHVIRYVGKTGLESVALRLLQHHRNPTNSRMAKWLQDLCRVGVEAECVILEICPYLAWPRKESRWIGVLREILGVNLLNRQRGSERLPGVLRRRKKRKPRRHQIRVGPHHSRLFLMREAADIRKLVAETPHLFIGCRKEATHEQENSRLITECGLPVNHSQDKGLV